MSSAKECSCANHLKLNQIMKLLQVIADGIPAIHIEPKSYDREIGARARYANPSLEQYMRKCCKTGGNGTLKINVALVTYTDVESLRCCKTQKVWTDTIDDMFCITTDGEIAIKITYDGRFLQEDSELQR